MSKLIELYKSLKSTNSNKLYLFKSGIFYIFLDEDAKIMSNVFKFKLTNLNSEYVKCGFPSNSFDKYINLIQQLNYDVEIIEPTVNNIYSQKMTPNIDSKIQNMLDMIISVDVDNLSVRDAFSFIDRLKELSKNIHNSINN